MHVLIVAGVGGSGEGHWQTWLERCLASQAQHSVSRVQQDWQRPILATWQTQLQQAIDAAPAPVLLVAHSFGCLVSVRTLLACPELHAQVAGLLMVAPADPARFRRNGVYGCEQQPDDVVALLHHPLPAGIPACVWVSQNDPWLGLRQAKRWARTWQVPLHNLGDVGHVNIASGFGEWPLVLAQVNMWPTPFFVRHRPKKHQRRQPLPSLF